MDIEQEFIELAGIRKVATPDGAAFYGLPIGAPITADVIAKKDAEKAAAGIKPPSGAIKAEGTKTVGKVGQHHDHFKPDAAAAPGAKAATKKKLKVKAKTELKGTKKFKVGKSTYSAPDGSKLIKPAAGPNLAYILTPDGKLHAFAERGEVEIPEALTAIFSKKFAGDYAGDDKYAVEEFDATSAPYAIEGLPVGAILTDPEGTPQFEKQEDGDWKHLDMDVLLEESDIKPLYDDGELIPEANATAEVAQEAFAAVEAMNFGEMSKEEFITAVDGMPEGTQLDFKGKVNNSVITKQADGLWLIDTPQAQPNNANTLFYMKSQLSIKGAGSLDPEAPAVDAPVDLPEDNPLVAPIIEKQRAEETAALKIGDSATPDWTLSTGPGSAISYGTAGYKVTWVKQDGGEWKADGEFSSVITDDAFADAIEKNPQLSEITKIKKEETPEPEPQISSQPDPAAKAEEPAPEPKISTQADPAAAKSDPAPPAPDSLPSGIPEGARVVTKEEALNSVTGDKVYQQKSDGATYEFTKQESGLWKDNWLDIDWEGEAVFHDNEGSLPIYKKSAEKAQAPEQAPEAPAEELADWEKELLAINTDPVEAPEDPEAAEETPAEAPEAFPVGSDIKGTEQLDQLPPSTKLAYLKKSGDTTIYTKLENGSFLTPGGGIMDSTQLKHAKFTVDSLPEPETTEVDANGDEVESDSPEVSLIPGGTYFSKADIKAAIDSMEAHSGFQIKYGLKAVADENPIAVPEVYQEITKLAVKQFPDMKPKPAFLAYLKNKAGFAPDVPEEKKESSTGPKITIGSKTPEKGVQGLSGGEFTQAEIEDAITILENFSGKIFKAELNKKGNALGVLNPNDIVGFDKDKTVTKQKFLDLLKSKNEKMKAAPEPEAKPKEKKERPKPVLTADEIISKPLGTVINLNTADEGEYTAVKTGEDTWSKEGGGDIPVSALKGEAAAGNVTLEASSEDNVPSAQENEKVPSLEVLETYENGTKIVWNDGKTKPQYLTKTAGPDNGLWISIDDAGETYTLNDHSLKMYIDSGELYLVSKPQSMPEYAQTPVAVQNKIQDPALVEEFGAIDAMDAPTGTTVKHATENKYYTKTDLDTTNKLTQKWEGYDADTNETLGGYSSTKIGDWIKQGVLLKPEPASPEFNQSGLTPGKYAGTGVAYMIVKADGTGVYVNAKGVVTALSVAKVQSNHAAGLQIYSGMPDTIPVVPAAVKKVATKKKVVDAKNMTIPDGTYFDGDPSTPKTTVYEVKGENVTIFKAKTSTTDSFKKIGQNVSAEWMEAASSGAQFYDYPYTWKKSETGQWINQDGEAMSDDKKNNYGWSTWGSEIQGHGSMDPVVVPVSKIHNLVKKGQFLDQYGTSIVPDGYSGKLYLFGGETTVPALLELKTVLATETEGLDGKIHNAGVYPKASLVKKYTTTHVGDNTHENKQKGMQQAVDNLLAGLDTEIPESDASELFEWDDLGYAKMPLELATLTHVNYQKGSQAAYIKAVSAHFGGGKIIGQHVSAMDQYERENWIDHFKEGNFKGMYNLEVHAAAAQSKPHAAGYLHPGYEGNEGTNTILWGPLVPGELPVKQTVPGVWSDSSLEWSLPEIDNFLISAQMQNPTHLSTHEKRSWVVSHLNGNATQRDLLSATAAQRAKEGQTPLTEAPVWTDNIKPAKLYDSLFDSTPYPLVWPTVKAKAYLADNKDNEELQKIWESKDGSYYQDMETVTEYFQKKQDEADALALIPVYTLKENQTVKQSTHPVYQYTDQFGKEYFFKPRANTKLDKYRSEVEHLGNMFGRFFGFSTSDSKLLTLNGQYGQLQSDVGGVKDLMGFDYSTLTATQIADIGSEHMLDWFLDNDDTKGDNAKILANGRIVGIDKGRAFKHFGAWKGLSGDSQMDSNAATIYNQLYSTIREGKLDKETVDKAYLSIQKKAKRMAKANDLTISSMLEEGMKNRDSYDISYTIDGKQVPQTAAGLEMAILDRKARLPQDIETMWEKIYADAGLGDLPEVPDNPLGDVISGLQDIRLHEEMFTVKASGKSTIVGGEAGVVGGTVLMWTDQYEDGSTNINGELYLGHEKQQQMLDYLIANATDLSAAQMSVTGFGQIDQYGSTLLAGAKTISHHAGDKNYNEQKVTAFQTAKTGIESDLGEWYVNLESNSTYQGKPSYKFASGANVPMEHLHQYKLMLDYYAPLLPMIQNAYDTNSKTEMVEIYSPLSVSKTPKKFTKGETVLSEMGDGSYLLADSVGVSVISGDTATSLTAQGGWTENLPDDVVTHLPGVTITKRAYTNEKDASFDGTDTKTVKKESAQGVQGSGGEEYEILLDTGEQIFFRNHQQTHTARGQRGKLMFRADGVEDTDASQAAVERIMLQLKAMGLDLTTPADHTDAELIYWREMANILENRNHDNSPKHKAAAIEMRKKAQEYGADEGNYLEIFAQKMDPDEQLAYWRALWAKHFGQDKIDKLIQEEGYLPKYDHQNLNNPEVETGKPYWDRFDVDVNEIVASGNMLMAATGGDPLDHAKSGAFLSAEERLRQLNRFISGGQYTSALSDQSKGSSHNIYTRVTKATDYTHYNAVFDPRVMLRTRVYSFAGDNYGNHDNRKGGSPSDPLYALKKYTGHGSNETSLSHMATLLDTIEVLAFDVASKRNEAIQHLKKLGIEKIRGLPIEDRLVMRADMQAAIKKAKEQWT